MLLLMLISKKVAAPMSKGSKKHGHPFTNVISKNTHKSGCPYINKMLKKWPLLCKSKFSKSSCHQFYLLQRANGKAVIALAKEMFNLNMCQTMHLASFGLIVSSFFFSFISDQ